MAVPGSITMSLRGDGPWRGMTTLTAAERGDRRQRLLENCYVSSDGSEIRTAPGFKTMVDLFGDNPRETGYWRDVVDMARPAAVTVGSYSEHNLVSQEDLVVWSKPLHIHGFEIVKGQLKLFGEMDLRRGVVVNSDYTARVKIVSFTAVGGTTKLNLDVDALTTPTDASPDGIALALAPNGGATAATVIAPSYILIDESATGTGAADYLAGRIHVVSDASVPNAIIIETDISAQGGSGSFIEPAPIWKVRRGLGPFPALPGENGTVDVRSLGIWTVIGQPGFDSPASVCGPAYVANRMRDCGDALGNVTDGRWNTDRSRRLQKSLPYRLVPHVSQSRLILAAPGYGCVFQAPVVTPIQGDDGYRTNDIFDRPRSLGIPKAVMYEDTEKDDPAVSWHGGSGGAASGTYTFAVAYKDEATGETGLISEFLTLPTTQDNPGGLKLGILFPGYLMSECLALSILVFRSIRDGTQPYFQQAINVSTALPGGAVSSLKYGLVPTGGLGATESVAYRYMIQFTCPNIADSDLDQDFPMPNFERMPMGCKDSATVGGYTFFGGRLGNAGRRGELWESSITANYAESGHFTKPKQLICRANQNTDPRGQDGTWLCAQHCIPPAYQGSEIAGLDLFPYPRISGLLANMVNIRANYDQAGSTGEKTPQPQMSWPRWDMLQAVSQVGLSRTKEGAQAWLKLPQGHYEISQEGEPWFIQELRGYIDDQDGGDIEAMGAHGESLVICTRSKTYVQSWSINPVMTDRVVRPQQANSEFGCIAANTMVEFDGGTAWISDRGPVAMIGGVVEWVGRELEALFLGSTSRYKRDSQGLMRHAWATHDPVRGLVLFGLFADRLDTSVTYDGETNDWDSSGDEAKSRFPCDEILVWNYRQNAWSIWRYPVAILWMTTGFDVEGVERVMFLGEDWRIYAFDDHFNHWNKEPLILTVAEDSAGSEIVCTTTFDDSAAARGAGDNFISNGMTVMVTDVNGVLRGISTLVGYDKDLKTLTVADAISVQVNDQVYLGVKVSTVETNDVNPTGSESQSTVRSIEVRLGMQSRFSLGASGTIALPVYLGAEVTTDRPGASTPTWVVSNYTNSTYDLVGRTEPVTVSRIKRFTMNKSTGREHSVRLDIVSGAQVRLMDLALEVP